MNCKGDQIDLCTFDRAGVDLSLLLIGPEIRAYLQSQVLHNGQKIPRSGSVV